MPKLLTLILVLALVPLSATGCKTKGQTGAAIGAVVGGGAGYLIGRNNGSGGTGAAIGAAVGAGGGYLIGDSMEDDDKDVDQPPPAKPD